VTCGRHVTLHAGDLDAAAAAIGQIEAWLRGAPGHVIAGLAASAYGGQPPDQALTLARELVCDLRWHSAYLPCAVHGTAASGENGKENHRR